MRTEQIDNPTGVWGEQGLSLALAQIADVIAGKVGPVVITKAPDNLSFKGVVPEGESTSGIESVSGRVVGELVIVRIELIRTRNRVMLEANPFFEQLGKLSSDHRLYREQAEHHPDEVSLGIELKVRAEPMSLTRENVLVDHLDRISAFARTLKENLPAQEDSNLHEKYRKMEDVLSPVMPLNQRHWTSCVAEGKWAKETLQFLLSGACVALASPYPVQARFGLSAIARAASESGQSIGRLLAPSISPSNLLSLAGKAPGIVAVPASSVSMSVNAYELGSVITSILSCLSSAGRPVLFFGTMSELQSIFHGGQGGANDPLAPVLRRVPTTAIEELTTYAVASAGVAAGGLPHKVLQSLTKEVLAVLSERPACENTRILPLVANHAVSVYSKSNTTNGCALSFAESVSQCAETFAGLSVRPRNTRSESVQTRFMSVLTDNSLGASLKDSIFSQDRAIDQLVSHLQSEVLSRPLHQPLRWCSQGTPATGKTESSVLIAHRLGIPYINIDAASMPSYYTACSQLLGSARGIVGSYQSGRLEQAAKHFEGALIEISDLDHAPQNVQSFLADLFLQVLDTGEAQSASGVTFSCANLVIVFTMNLPHGQDESLRHSMGFAGTPAGDQLLYKATKAIKEMLSSAFLSRIGTPILFDPLSNDAMAMIVERTLQSAVEAAIERLGLERKPLAMQQGLGRQILAKIRSNTEAFGARILMERARLMATAAVLRLCDLAQQTPGNTYVVSSMDGQEVVIDTAERRD